jgi:hypothetical protein
MTTTNGVARNYGQLKVGERLALLGSACARDDQTEANRLMVSAPVVSWRGPDVYRDAAAFDRFALLTYLDVLALAAAFLEATAEASRAAHAADTDPSQGDALQEYSDVSLAAAFLLRTRLAGWREHCGELGIEDADKLWRNMPGLERVRLAEERVSRMYAGLFDLKVLKATAERLTKSA